MRRHLPLVLVLLLAAVLRLIFLGSVPSGFTADEASQGYAAYSLLKTGQDEWGLSWPITSFRAFADYRAPLQTYLIIPSVAIFGLNEFATRLPSAVFGILAVLAVYLLVNELFPKSQISIGHLAALFLAISPWSIQFSRTALEANFASFLFPFGLFLLLRGLRSDKKLLWLSAIFFGLDLYSYLAAKLFVPLFLLSFFVFYRLQLNKKFKQLIPFAVIFSLFAIPIYVDTFLGPGNVRGKDLSITNFSRENLESISREQYYSKLNTVSPVITRTFSNKLTFTAHQFIGNYMSYLSPTFWFTEGGREITYSVFPGHGLLYLWLLPFVVYGLHKLVVGKHKYLPLLALWLFLAIIPAAVTKEGYRPNRVGSLMTFWEIIAAYGLLEFLSTKIGRIRHIRLGLIVIATVYLVSYLNLYLFLSSIKYPQSLSYGYRDLIKKINLYVPKYNSVIIDRGSQSQIFIAFYNRMDPRYFQQYSQKWWPEIERRKLLFVDMLDPYLLDKYVFKSINPRSDLVSWNLVVIRGDKMNPDLKQYVIDKVDYPDQSTAFYLLAQSDEE